MGTCAEVSRDDATQMFGWVSCERKKARFFTPKKGYSRSSFDVRFFAAAPSVRSFRLFWTIASHYKWGVAISDVATAFLNATLPPKALYAVEVPLWLLRYREFGD